MTNIVNEDNTVFCTQCGHKHKLKDMLSTPFFADGKSYYCPTVSEPKEVARARDGELLYWNGREFEKTTIHIQ